MDENTKRKVANNAATSYAFIGWMFLFAKDNKLINNDFVKSHIKSASLIHIGIIITTIVFLVYKLGNIINIFGIEGNIILATISFLFLGILLFVGAYKAYHFEQFGIGSTIKFGHKKIIEKNNSHFGEKDKLTLVLAHIPFLGNIITSKYDANKEIRNILRVNLVATVFLIFIYVTGYKNLTLLFSLIYIIYVTFVGINLFTQSELININISRFFSPNEQIKYVKAFLKYLYYYLKGDFKKFDKLKQKEDTIAWEKEETLKEILNKSSAFAGPKWIIYIPILNLVTFFQRKTNYMIHIKNGIIITFITILLFFLVFIFKLHYIWGLFLLFPICVGIGNLYKKVYIMPYIFEIYESWVYFLRIFNKSKRKIQQKKKEIHEVSYKVGNNNHKGEKVKIQKPIDSPNIPHVEMHSPKEPIKK